MKYYKYSLKQLLLEDKYNFQGKAGSTGGLVANALFQFSPTIKVKRFVGDGDDDTDMVVDIGSGYTVTEKKDGTPNIQLTNPVEADIEIGFNGKSIFLGTLVPKRFEGGGIKPGVYAKLRITTKHTGVPKAVQDATNTAGALTLSWETKMSIGNNTKENMSSDKFHKLVMNAMESLETSWVGNLKYQIAELESMYPGELQKEIKNYQAAIEYLERIHPARRIREDTKLLFPNTKRGRDLVASLYKTSFGITFVWEDGKPKLSGPSNVVDPIKLDKPIDWMEYVPQKNQDKSEELSQTSHFRKLQDWWPKNTPYPFENNPTIFQGDIGNTVFDEQETLLIWESLGDDYFIFLDVQGDTEIARTARTSSAPYPGVGYFKEMEKQEQQGELLFDSEGNPKPVDIIQGAIQYGPKECFQWETQEDGTKKIVATPAMTLRTFPLLSDIVAPSQLRFWRDKSLPAGTFQIRMNWDSWNWTSVPSIPFSKRMIHRIKKYLISSGN